MGVMAVLRTFLLGEAPGRERDAERRAAVACEAVREAEAAVAAWRRSPAARRPNGRADVAETLLRARDWECGEGAGRG